MCAILYVSVGLCVVLGGVYHTDPCAELKSDGRGASGTASSSSSSSSSKKPNTNNASSGGAAAASSNSAAAAASSQSAAAASTTATAAPSRPSPTPSPPPSQSQSSKDVSANQSHTAASAASSGGAASPDVDSPVDIDSIDPVVAQLDKPLTRLPEQTNERDVASNPFGVPFTSSVHSHLTIDDFELLKVSDCIT